MPLAYDSVPSHPGLVPLECPLPFVRLSPLPRPSVDLSTSQPLQFPSGVPVFSPSVNVPQVLMVHPETPVPLELQGRKCHSPPLPYLPILTQGNHEYRGRTEGVSGEGVVVGNL